MWGELIGLAQLAVGLQNVYFNSISAKGQQFENKQNHVYQEKVIAALKGIEYSMNDNLYHQTRDGLNSMAKEAHATDGKSLTHMGGSTTKGIGMADMKAANAHAYEEHMGKAASIMRKTIAPIVGMFGTDEMKRDLVKEMMHDLDKEMALLPAAEKAKIERWADRIDESMGASKYHSMAKRTGDKRYDEMAADEQKHAHMLGEVKYPEGTQAKTYLN